MLDLKQRRIELGLTMLEVAKLVGVSEATISRYESGNIRNMRRDRIEKYAKALQVRPSEFLDIDDDYIKTQEFLKKLINPDNMSQQVKEIAELEEKIIKAISKNEDAQLKIDEELKKIEATRKKWEEIMQKMSDDNRQKLQDYAELLLLKQNQGGRGD